MALPSLRALRHRNFRIFLSGQVVAIIGYWVQLVAQSWLLYRLSGLATLLGVLSFASSVPILILAPIAGLWADRCNLHRAMFTIQMLECLQAIILATLALTGVIAPWHIITLAMCLGILVAFELPIRHAYLLELVEGKEDLSNAIALTSLMVNCGRLVGPAIAGLLIGLLSEAHCFLINALSFIAVIITLSMIRVTPLERTQSNKPALTELLEGFKYAWHIFPIRALLFILSAVAFFGTTYSTLMPVMVRQVFIGQADTMGFLMGAAGFGAVCGTLFLATRHNVRGLICIIMGASFSAGIALLLFAHAPSALFAMPLMVVIGFGVLVTSVSINMILQTIVDDDKRGRIMSLYTAAFLGIMPFGALTAGTVADWLGPRFTLTLSGTCCAIAASILMNHRQRLRLQVGVIYDRLGLAHKKSSRKY